METQASRYRVKNVEGSWRIMDVRSGKIWPAKYSSRGDAQEALERSRATTEIKKILDEIYKEKN